MSDARPQLLLRLRNSPSRGGLFCGWLVRLTAFAGDLVGRKIAKGAAKVAGPLEPCNARASAVSGPATGVRQLPCTPLHAAPCGAPAAWNVQRETRHVTGLV